MNILETIKSIGMGLLVFSPALAILGVLAIGCIWPRLWWIPAGFFLVAFVFILWIVGSVIRKQRG